MGKKPATTKMSLTELSAKFGGDMGAAALPTQSEGKDFGKSKGKGLRPDFEDNRAELADWRTGGGKGGGGFGDRDGGGKGMRSRRDDGNSRADEGDWFAKERPMGGDRGGDRDRRDRDDRGGDRMGGGRRDSDRRGGNDTQAEQDGDWRGGMGRDREDRDRGFGDRDRDRDRDRGGFGRRGDDDGPRAGASERPRLALKPRSKPLPGQEGGETPAADDDGDRRSKPNPFGGARAVDKEEGAKPPWKKNRDDDGSEDLDSKQDSEDLDKDDDRKESTGKAAAGGKWIPPSLRKKMEDEQAEERAREDSRRKMDDDRRKRDEERRRADDEARKRKEDDGFETVKRGAASSEKKSGGYVPPAQRAAREAEERKQAEREAKEKEEARKAKEKEEARKREAAEAKARKDQEARERKEAEKAAFAAKIQKPQKASDKDELQDADQEKLDAFATKCEALISDAKAKVEKLADEVPKILGEDELKTVGPIRGLIKPLVGACKEKAHKEVVSAIARFAPLIKRLIRESKVHRFKVKVLVETQRACNDVGLPRLAPESALIEALFDGLYSAEIIEEDYYEMWAVHNDDTPGKMTALFQLSDFMEWLRTGKYEGEESSDEEDEDEEDEDEEEASEGSDIEANVPKRAGARPLR